MDLRSADDIRLVLEEGSISDAAKRLNISQPALSSRIRKIEESYGIQLFKRNRRPVVLTSEGKRYLEHIDRIQDLDKSFRQTVMATEKLLTGNLAIGGTHLYTCHFLPAIVKEYSSRFPGISIRIVNEKASVLTMMAAKGELDLFVTNMRSRAQGICYEALFPVKMLVCVPREYPVNEEFEEGGFDFGKLEQYPFILLGKDQYMGSVMRRLFRRYRINPSGQILVDQAITAFALSEAGVGVSLVYDLSFDDDRVASGSCCYYEIDDPEMLVDLAVAYPASGSLSPAAKAFVGILKEHKSKG